MGHVKVSAFLGSPERARAEEVTFLADTGAYYTVLPPGLAERLAVRPVAIMEAPEPLLGATAMEGLGIKVDPKTGKLEEMAPEGGYLLRAH